jgi:N-acetylneuraminate synthase
MHACSVYPSAYNELNLAVIPTFRARYKIPIGYSGHESGLATTVAAVALGACVVERHITLDRAMWGSDQAASVGPSGLTRLVRDIRLVETAMGSPEKHLLEREIPVMRKLRRKG